MSDDRTVTVRLEAAVSGYIRDIRLAGAATDQAFRSNTRSAANLNRGVTDITASLNGLRTTTERTRPSLTGLRRDVDGAGGSINRASAQIDRYSGRLKLIAQGLSLLGPAAIPIAALAAPAVAGLATQLLFAAAAGGTALLAFQGVGDALKAMNKAHLEPTAANLQAAQIAMENLGPAAQHLVTQLRGLTDEGRALRDAAAEGFLPGVSEALDELESRGPQVERILTEIGDAAGDALAGGAESLASERWDEFFTFLETEGRETLSDLAKSVGNVSHAVATLLVTADPLSDDFTSWLVDATEDLDNWADKLDETEGFQDFIDYVRTNGPQVADTVGAIGSALLDVIQAAAPIGGPILQGLEAFAKVISAIANSDIGTPLFGLAAALSALSLAQRGLAALRGTLTGLGGTFTPITAGVTRASTGVRAFSRDLGAMRREYGRMGAISAVMTSALSNTTGAAQRTRASLAAVGRTAGLLGGLGLVTSGVAGDMGLMNTATLALAGAMLGGGPWGAAIGGGIGLMLDFKAAQSGGAEAASEFSATLDQQTGALTENSRLWAAKKLLDAGALDDAKTLGLNLSDVTDAVLGQGDALDVLVPKLEALRDAEVERGLAAGRGGDSSGMAEGAKEAERLLGVMEELGLVVKNGRGEYQLTAAAIGEMGGKAKESSKSVQELGYEALAAADSATTLAQALEGLLTPGLNLSASWDALREGLRNLDDELAEHTRSLTANTDGADKNRAAIRGQVASIQAVLNAEAEAGASKGRLARILDNQTEALIRTGIAEGFAGKELRAFLRTAGLTPKMIRTAFEAAGLTEAKVNAQSLLRTYRGFPKGLKTEIRANGIPQTMAKVNALDRKYGLTEKQRTALIDLMDKASPNIRKVLGLLDKTARQKPKPIVDAHIDRAMSAFGTVLKKAQDVDRQKPNPKVTADTGAAASSLNNLLGLLRAADGFHAQSTVTNTIVTVREFQMGSGPGQKDSPHSAAGNFFASVNRYAGGDVVNRHEPEFAGPGPTRIWREPETLGESYIPHANDWRRPRAKAITEQTAGLMGGTVTWHAAGSWTPNVGPTMHKVTGGRGYATGGGVGGHITVSGTLDSPLGLVRIVDARARVVAQAENDADRDFDRMRSGG